MQILVALEGPMVLADGRASQLACDAVVIPSCAPHAIVHGPTRGLLLYLSPEWFADPTWVMSPSAELEEWVRLSRIAGVDQLGVASRDWPRSGLEATRSIMTALCLPQINTHIAGHPAVRELMQLLPDRLDGPLRLTALAGEIGISVDRLAHVIRSDLGVPFRSYVLNLRLHRTYQLLATHRTLTDAAHSAGFADAAHFSRVFRRMHGFAPIELVRHTQRILDDSLI
ncbi:helix-turn-helix transcriptional regulator [Nocardia sp. NPDC051570]|uniref:helix-turn-helix transcriptional regulator n=1 Tax=Nocardia sp. NPDC051570 TaxID=3364324 RepID=UPI0037A9B2D8